MRRRALIAALIAVSMAAGVACGTGESGPRAEDIVSDIPWTAPETYRYVMQNDDQETLGEAVFAIEREGDTFVMTREFSDNDGNADESSVTVDATTLKPIRGVRSITDDESRRVAEFEYAYQEDEGGDDLVNITQKTYDPPDSDEPDSTRSNPLRVKDSSYDTHSSLFIWRTIKFEEGYRVTYREVFSNRRAERKITLEVRGQERVETPAGQFDAWLVRISDDNDHQEAWFATTDDHKLLVYDNGSQIFLYNGTGDGR